MCGISGFIRKNPVGFGSIKAKHALLDLSYFSRLRGVDALGVFKVKSNAVSYVKEVGDPYALILKNEKIKSFLINVEDNEGVVYHNRHATKGGKTAADAHPFQFEKSNKKGSIILVHNGTVGHIKEDHEEKYRGRTDSESIAKMVADGMSLTDIEHVLWGSFALVWYDSELRTYNFFRNSERTLGFVDTKDYTFFGSEIYMVAAAIERVGENVEKLERLPVHTHWIYHAEEKEWEKNEVKIKEYKSSSPLPTTPPSSHTPKSRTKVEQRYGKYSHNKKGKFVRTTNVFGVEVGSRITFSLTECNSTKRPNQTYVEGNFVTFGGRGGLTPALDTHVDVVGMVGSSVEKVKNCPKFYTATVTECLQRKQGETYTYRFMVSDIKEDKLDDPFREFQRSKKAPDYTKFDHHVFAHTSKIQVKETPEETKDVDGALAKIIRKAEERMFADAPKNKGTCHDCLNEYEARQLHRISHKEKAVSISLCGRCFSRDIVEDSRMQKLFGKAEEERLRSQTKTMH